LLAANRSGAFEEGDFEVGMETAIPLLLLQYDIINAFRVIEGADAIQDSLKRRPAVTGKGVAKARWTDSTEGLAGGVTGRGA